MATSASTIQATQTEQTAIQTAPFYAKSWRDAWTHTDLDTGEVRSGLALWAVYDSISGTRFYVTSELAARKAADKWNAGQMPDKVERYFQAARYLKELLRPGDTVQTILRHVSRSGMMRHISVTFKGEDITWQVAALLDEKRANDGGIKVGGCGMDMGFHLVSGMSAKLFPDGFECIGRDLDGVGGRRRYCPANDHCNGDRDYTPHMHPNAGDYAISNQWL